MLSRRPTGSVEVVVVLEAGAPERLVEECVRRAHASRRVRAQVRLAGPAPAIASGSWAAPAPGGTFLLELPWYAGLGPSSLARLADPAGGRPVGLTNILLPGARDGSTPVRLWRGTAIRQAQRQRRPGEDLVAAAGRLSGVRWEAGTPFGIVDLRRPPASGVDPLPLRAARLARDRMPPGAYAWLAPRVKESHRRVRNYLFLD